MTTERTRAGAELKQEVLSHKVPSHVESIAEALVIKDEGVFFLCDRDGQVPLDQRHGFGLYHHDCRFLDGYELRVAGEGLHVLCGTPQRGFTAILELTNRPFRADDGSRVGGEELGVRWRRTIDSEALALKERIEFRNYGTTRFTVPLTLTFRSGFEDVFHVRGLLPRTNAESTPARWDDGRLGLEALGHDGLLRGLRICFDPSPTLEDGATARYSITLEPGEHRDLAIVLALYELGGATAAPSVSHVRHHDDAVASRVGRSEDEWLERQTRFRSDSVLLEKIVDRAQRDLRVLRTRLDGHHYFAAGVPWFATLFGRDSLIAALETLAFDPEIAEPTLRLLALHQGTEEDDWRDEEPGKILHELRVGELARSGVIPHTPYYGTVDATPLFLILLGRHANWTGDLRLFDELRDPVERALAWVDRFDGFLEYDSGRGEGLVNQGWKDSGDAIVDAEGRLAQPPIALCEVQGYAYWAKRSAAELFERRGDSVRAKRLRREADDLHERFNRAFWLADREFFALALQGDGRPAAVIASNAGQALWSGIVASDKAARVGERLLAEDMFNGWGVRTLSSMERAYHPIGYHRGTVWPHDNALIAAGLKRYGMDALARRLFTGMTDAALHFPSYRLPEVFAGFRREDFGTPVHYPVACSPQAWSSGALLYFLETFLGLSPDGFGHQLRIIRPWLPDMADWVELHRLPVGRSRVDLRFERTGREEEVRVEVLRNEGPELTLILES